MQLFVRANNARTINLGFMKRTFLLLILAFIFCSLKGYSQTVNFSGKKVQLKKIFSVIKSQTGYVFFYDAALLREAKPVTIDLKNVTIEEALHQTLKDQPLGWVVENKTITTIKKPTPATNAPQESSVIRPTKITGT